MRSKVVFCWSGFPQYAARCVGAFVKRTGADVKVIATRPKVPVEGMENLCGCPVRWVEWDDMQLDVGNVDVVCVTGWHVPAFVKFFNRARRGGSRVVCMIDNNMSLMLSPRERATEVAKKWRFKLLKERLFDGYIVPGRSGRRLLEWYGVDPSLISEGMYSADSLLFYDGGALDKRPKRVIYVGQFSERKNVRRLCDAFRALIDRDGWELHMYGCGPIKIASGDGVVAHPFRQPDELAGEYRMSRVFCLPSIEEHWGLVVHEAALSGCALCLSERIGAAEDFIGEKNGRTFDPFRTADLSAKLSELMSLDGEELCRVHDESVRLASRASLDRFVEAVSRWLNKSNILW